MKNYHGTPQSSRRRNANHGIPAHVTQGFAHSPFKTTDTQNVKKIDTPCTRSTRSRGHGRNTPGSVQSPFGTAPSPFVTPYPSSSNATGPGSFVAGRDSRPSPARLFHSDAASVAKSTGLSETMRKLTIGSDESETGLTEDMNNMNIGSDKSGTGLTEYMDNLKIGDNGVTATPMNSEYSAIYRQYEQEYDQLMKMLDTLHNDVAEIQKLLDDKQNQIARYLADKKKCGEMMESIARKWSQQQQQQAASAVKPPVSFVHVANNPEDDAMSMSISTHKQADGDAMTICSTASTSVDYTSGIPKAIVLHVVRRFIRNDVQPSNLKDTISRARKDDIGYALDELVNGNFQANRYAPDAFKEFSIDKVMRDGNGKVLKDGLTNRRFFLKNVFNLNEK